MDDVPAAGVPGRRSRQVPCIHRGNKAETGEEAGVAEIPRLPRIPFAAPQCRREDGGQYLSVCPVYASSFAQPNQKKRTVAEIQASGGLEEDL